MNRKGDKGLKTFTVLGKFEKTRDSGAAGKIILNGIRVMD
jgi:hypothetical protein